MILKKISSLKEDFQYLVEGIEDTLAYYPEIDHDVALKILALDPTFKAGVDKVGTYGKWLLTREKQGADLLSKAAEVKQALSSYNDLKKRKKLPAELNDLGRVKSVEDLLQLLKDNAEAVEKNDVQLAAERLDPHDVEFITRGNGWEVWRPLTFEGAKGLAGIGETPGHYAAWCTNGGVNGHQYSSDGSYFRQYTSGAKLYIFIPINNPRGKLQVQIHDNGAIGDCRMAHSPQDDGSEPPVNFPKFIMENHLEDLVLNAHNFPSSGVAETIRVLRDIENGQPLEYHSGTMRQIGNSIGIGDLYSMITNIVIAEDVTRIDANAFAGCTSLTNINLPNGIVEIASGAFKGCTSLSNITLPDGLVKIGPSAFEECEGLTRINLPGGVKEIGDGAFNRCSNLANINMPAEVESIGNSAFEDCRALTDIEIPAGVAEINDHVFRGCSSLAHVTLHDGLKKINRLSFKGCTPLGRIDLPITVTWILTNAFMDCPNVQLYTPKRSGLDPEGYTGEDDHRLHLKGRADDIKSRIHFVERG